jgi:hypothetical protein
MNTIYENAQFTVQVSRDLIILQNVTEPLMVYYNPQEYYMRTDLNRLSPSACYLMVI